MSKDADILKRKLAERGLEIVPKVRGELGLHRAARHAFVGHPSGKPGCLKCPWPKDDGVHRAE